MKLNLNTNVKKFYINTYPTDTEGEKIRSNLTFRTLLSKFVLEPDDIYDILGVGDSIIRERIFEALSKILKCDYDVIYDIWLED
jgi:hypothetical protein